MGNKVDSKGIYNFKIEGLDLLLKESKKDLEILKNTMEKKIQKSLREKSLFLKETNEEI